MMEAMSTGCALAASGVAPVREIASEKEASLVSHTNITALADRILELLNNPEKRAAMGANARAKILENYSAQSLYKEKMDWLMRLHQQKASMTV